MWSIKYDCEGGASLDISTNSIADDINSFCLSNLLVSNCPTIGARLGKAVQGGGGGFLMVTEAKIRAHKLLAKKY